MAVIEYLRLAGGTLLVLLPGWLVARAFGQRSASATLVWAIACVFAAWSVVFVAHGTIWVAVGVLAAIAVVAGIVAGAKPRSFPARPRGSGAVLGLGVVLGWLLWHVANALGGDAL